MSREAGVPDAASLLPVAAGFVVICAVIVAVRGDRFERVCDTAMVIGFALMFAGLLVSRLTEVLQKTKIYALPMLLCIVTTSFTVTATAQDSGAAKVASTPSTMVSGGYGGGMLIGVNPATQAVTGYFSEDNIQGQFSCTTVALNEPLHLAHPPLSDEPF